MVVVQPEERNMYDQHWLSATLTERYPFCITTDSSGIGIQDSIPWLVLLPCQMDGIQFHLIPSNGKKLNFVVSFVIKDHNTLIIYIEMKKNKKILLIFVN